MSVDMTVESMKPVSKVNPMFVHSKISQIKTNDKP
jgi:hypothetical protein